MYQLPRVGRYFVYTNIFVALCTAALVHSSVVLLDLTSSRITWFTFFSTLASYNFMRLYQLLDSTRAPKAPLHRWINEHRFLIGALVVIGLSGSAYHFFHFERLTQWFIIPLGGLSFLYAVRLPGKNGRRLREVPGFKIFMIALLWSLVTVTLPAIEAGAFGSVEGALLTAERFLFIFAITLPFDIRDLPFDGKELQTIPQRYGMNGAKGIGLFAILIMDLLIVWQWGRGFYTLPEMIALIGVAKLAVVGLFMSNPDRPEPYYSVGIEGLSLLWLLALWLAQLF